MGWAVGEGGSMLYTTNGGEIWLSRNLPTSLPLSTIEFSYFPVGWTAAGESLTPGESFKTTDGGYSWEIVSTISLPPGFYEIQFTSSEVGWIMTANGTSVGIQRLYRTINGGDNWEIVRSNSADTT